MNIRHIFIYLFSACTCYTSMVALTCLLQYFHMTYCAPSIMQYLLTQNSVVCGGVEKILQSQVISIGSMIQSDYKTVVSIFLPVLWKHLRGNSQDNHKKSQDIQISNTR